MAEPVQNWDDVRNCATALNEMANAYVGRGFQACEATTSTTTVTTSVTTTTGAAVQVGTFTS